MSSVDHADILRDQGAAVECPHSVLLVDDESVVLEVLSSALQRAGFRVGIARDANEVLTRVRHAAKTISGGSIGLTADSAASE